MIILESPATKDKPRVTHSYLDLRSSVCFIELTSTTCWRLSSNRQLTQSKFRNMPGLSYTSHPHRQEQLLSGTGQFKSEEQSSRERQSCDTQVQKESTLHLHLAGTGWHRLASSTGNPSRLHQAVSSLTALVTMEDALQLAQIPLYSFPSFSRHRAAPSPTSWIPLSTEPGSAVWFIHPKQPAPGLPTLHRV